ncbi:hypothetical protein LXM94_18450 [Rhizobium sp. TRM95111]|uniref:hypothetical protein n=1 Tax=Rhizobium alarense TaxID=2846851 RepID=UPI001F2E32F1|nr:hypothetical protein [Rhizobium alarense]MCF3641952.1 hypothetical protein [Rhizobium alarense]
MSLSLTSVLKTAVEGMRLQSSRLAAVARDVAGPAGTSAVENADPLQALTTMLDAETGFKANAAAFETGADLWDVLLSVKRD